MSSYGKHIFKKKRNQKYPRNAIYSYKNVNNDGKKFDYKDFRNNNCYNTTFKRSTFFGTKFVKSTMKYCSFGGAYFTAVEFKNCNFRGSRFPGAIFEECAFYNCKFDKALFKDTKFKNCYVEGTSFKKSKGDKPIITKVSELNVDTQVLSEVKVLYKNTKVSNFITTKNIARLLNNHSINSIKKSFDKIIEKPNIDEVTYSHIIKFI